MTKVIKSKKPKPRIKVAPPGKRHKSVKDYDRKLCKRCEQKLLSDWVDLLKMRDGIGLKIT